jgi:hypothetical protein
LIVKDAGDAKLFKGTPAAADPKSTLEKFGLG